MFILVLTNILFSDYFKEMAEFGYTDPTIAKKVDFINIIAVITSETEDQLIVPDEIEDIDTLYQDSVNALVQLLKSANDFEGDLPDCEGAIDLMNEIEFLSPSTN
jgi:hypothetical protein